ncbi:MAG: hypothetical protein M1820_009056 [Bogoriella megaspora]|nr:MAG: hypothetical protein M1820_009056 [Bogoriella megaspora]
MAEDKSNAREAFEAKSSLLEYTTIETKSPINDGATELLSGRYSDNVSRKSSVSSVQQPPLPSRARSVYDRLHRSRLQALFQHDTASAGSRRNHEVDELLQTWAKEKEKEVKILLSGSSGSGKATLLRHLKILYGNPYTEDERRRWRSDIFKNVLTSAHDILSFMYEERLNFENSDNRVYADYITSAPRPDKRETLICEHLVEALKRLRVDKGYRLAMSQILEDDDWSCNARYILELHFLKNLERLEVGDYLPVDEDILHTDKRLSGITELVCQIGDRQFRIYELGGSRGERKKWIHLLDDTTAVFCLVALDEYDQTLLEDDNVMCMHEAIKGFESTARSRLFSNSALVVCFTKFDVFRGKIQSGKHPVSKYFPDYRGGLTDVNAAKEFFADKFRKVGHTVSRLVRVQFVNILDSESVKEVIDAL